MINRHFIYILLIFVLAFSVFAQEPLSLSESLRLALEKNYDIRVGNIDETIAKTNNSWGKAGLLPTVDFTLSGSHLLDLDNSDWQQQSATGGVTLNWLLFNGFSVHIQKQKLEQLEDLSNGNTSLLIEQTIQAVILSYYNVLLQQQQKDAFNKIRSLSLDRYKQVQERKNLGALVTYDVLQAKNAWLEDEARFLQQEATCHNAMRTLDYLMGFPEDNIFNLVDSLRIDWKHYDYSTLKDQMLSDNRMLRNKYIQQYILNSNVKIARTDMWPTISLRTGFDGDRIRTDSNGAWAYSDSKGFFGTLSLTWNLFSGGNKNRAVKIAKMDREIGQIELEALQHSLAIQLTTHLEQYNVNKKLLDVETEALQTAELNLQISKEKFRSGAISSFNYRDVQLIYLNAVLGRLQSIYSLIESHLELLRLTGGIVSSRYSN